MLRTNILFICILIFCVILFARGQKLVKNPESEKCSNLEDIVYIWANIFSRTGSLSIISNEATLDTFEKTEYDDHHNCKTGCCRPQGIPNSCTKAMSSDRTSDGVYLLKTSNSQLKPFGAICKHINNTEWMIIQNRKDGSVNFHRNWQDYKNGFGNLNGEYWLGLERVHALTNNRTHELYVEYQNKCETFSIRCSRFSIAAENESYRISTKECFSNNHFARLVIPLSNERNFSTYDNENDRTSRGKCALTTGAWWHGAYCLTNSPNGAMNSGDYVQNIFMAIRPV